MSTPTQTPPADTAMSTHRPIRRYVSIAAVLVVLVVMILAAVATMGGFAREHHRSGPSTAAAAASQIGVRFSWGGGDLNGPTNGIRDGGLADTFHDYDNPGWDSSSLARFAIYKATGKKIARTCGPQSAGGQPVANKAAALPGDLVFFGGEGTAHHVGIYMGDGKMINAPQPGSKVRVDDIDSLGERPTFRRYA